MERDVQQRLCVAAERMGTGLLRTGAALERIAKAMEEEQVRERKADRDKRGRGRASGGSAPE